MKDLAPTIGRNIALLRKARNLTQGQLAEQFNYTDKSVSKWEHGDICPDINTLDQLAEFFGVTIDYLTHYHSSVEIETKHNKDPRVITTNRVLIVLMFIVMVWTIAAVVFAGYMILDKGEWYQALTSFVWAIPITTILLVIFNRKWGKSMFKLPLALLTTWTIVGAVYYSYAVSIESGWELWFILFIGLPLTGAIIFIYLYNKLKRNSQSQ